MRYIVVRTYGNGQHMNKVYPEVYKYLSAAQKKCGELNSKRERLSNEDLWICMPLIEHDSADWE